MTEILYKELSYAIVGAAMEVHKTLGPNFLESIYHKALAYELLQRGIPFESEKPIQVYYKGQLLGDFKADMVVDNKIILELKSVSAIIPVHEAQALNYLAATGFDLAIILNFGSQSLQQKRIAKSIK